MHSAQLIVVISNLNSMITILVLGTPVLILILFLPAIVELKKPQDSGPRIITDQIPTIRPATESVFHLTNIEEEQKIESLLFRLSKIIDFLPNLEA
jgi:hypothetical protein